MDNFDFGWQNMHRFAKREGTYADDDYAGDDGDADDDGDGDAEEEEGGKRTRRRI